jgi:hypothetical protein
MEGYCLQPGCFFKSQHDVHILHGLTCGAFYKVVNRSDNNQRIGALVNLESYMAEIC